MPLQAREKRFGLHSLSDEPFGSWIHLQSDAVYESRVTALTAKEHIPDTIWRIAPLIIFDLSRPSFHSSFTRTPAQNLPLPKPRDIASFSCPNH